MTSPCGSDTVTAENPGWRWARTFVARNAASAQGAGSRTGTTAGGSPGPRSGAAVTRAMISSIVGGAARACSGGRASSGGASGSNGSRGAPSARTPASSASTSARKASNPSARTRNLSRLRSLFTRSPRAWNTRTTASASARRSSAGRNSRSGAPAVQSEEVPPATVTANPRTLRPSSARTRARNPRSWIAVAT